LKSFGFLISEAMGRLCGTREKMSFGKEKEGENPRTKSMCPVGRKRRGRGKRREGRRERQKGERKMRRKEEEGGMVKRLIQRPGKEKGGRRTVKAQKMLDRALIAWVNVGEPKSLTSRS
jgi:hypothetical protein